MFNLFSSKKKSFFPEADEERMVQAIRSAEMQTSGEIRVFIENHCAYINAIDRAMELFPQLDMHQTKERNGVLLYFAMKDKQLAILADEGIYQKMGQIFWDNEVKQIIAAFREQHFIDGICQMIGDVGQALKTHFPYQRDDRNELPDGIVFGR